MAWAWRASYRAAAGPSTTRIFHRTFIPPEVLTVTHIIAVNGAFQNGYRRIIGVFFAFSLALS
jgi:hypothetical protein